MDGTLLNSKGEVSDLFFSQFKKLQQFNIHFVAASGRQYNSIVDKLSIIKDDIFVIAENGGIVKKGNQLIKINALSPIKIRRVIPTLRKIKGANIVLCGKNGAFIESKNQDFINLFQEYYHSYKIIDDLTKIADKEDFLKIAVYHFESSEKNIYPIVKALQNEVLIKISGKNWLDISESNANKGNALKEVQNLLNISKEETLVFGDYHNDLEMLQEAKFSFAMENAHKDIKDIANYSTTNNDNFGVEKILQKIITDKTIALLNADQ